MPLCKYEAVQHVQGAQGVGCRLRDRAFLSRSSSFFSVALSRFHFHFLLFFAFPLHFILESYHSPFYSFIHNTSIYIKKAFFLVCIKRPVNPQVNSNRPFRSKKSNTVTFSHLSCGLLINHLQIWQDWFKQQTRSQPIYTFICHIHKHVSCQCNLFGDCVALYVVCVRACY